MKPFDEQAMLKQGKAMAEDSVDSGMSEKTAYVYGYMHGARWMHQQLELPSIQVGGYTISEYQPGGYWITGPDGDGMQTTKKFEALIAEFFKKEM